MQITFSDAGVEREALSGGGGWTGPGPTRAGESSAAGVFHEWLKEMKSCDKFVFSCQRGGEREHRLTMFDVSMEQGTTQTHL